jgi:5-formyltetrahydrofolate cyclo-ligase
MRQRRPQPDGTAAREVAVVSSGEVAQLKAALRRTARAARRDLTAEERRAAAERAAIRLLALPEVWRSPTILLYAAGPEELDAFAVLDRLIERERSVLLPRVRDDDLELARLTGVPDLVSGFRGIREPAGPRIDPSVVDVAVVPGVAFDLDGGRLGHGGGHYDRLLAELEPDAVRIGLCFSCQVVPRVPREPHDQVVDIVVTDRAVHRTGARREPQDA